MAVFRVISNLTDKGAETIVDKLERIMKNQLKQVRKLKNNTQFIDFVIVEVENVEAFFRALVELNSRGTVRTKSYLAIPVDDAIKALKASIGHPHEKK